MINNTYSTAHAHKLCCIAYKGCHLVLPASTQQNTGMCAFEPLTLARDCLHAMMLDGFSPCSIVRAGGACAILSRQRSLKLMWKKNPVSTTAGNSGCQSCCALGARIHAWDILPSLPACILLASRHYKRPVWSWDGKNIEALIWWLLQESKAKFPRRIRRR